MSYVFTDGERTEIIRAIKQCTGLNLIKNTNGEIISVGAKGEEGTNVAPVYAKLSTLLAQKLQSLSQYDLQTQKDIVSVKLWLDVALGANQGIGAQSDFIRTYTNQEGLLRLSHEFDSNQMQPA